MKKIKITKQNEQMIEAVLDEVQQRCRVRKVSAHNILDLPEILERKLQIPKKYMEGLTCIYDHNAENFPGAYNGIPESTICVVERGRSAWYLVSIHRGRTRRENRRFVLDLPDMTKEALIDRFKAFYM